MQAPHQRLERYSGGVARRAVQKQDRPIRRMHRNKIGCGFQNAGKQPQTVFRLFLFAYIRECQQQADWFPFRGLDPSDFPIRKAVGTVVP